MYNHSLIRESTTLPLRALNTVRRMHCKMKLEYEECEICPYSCEICPEILHKVDPIHLVSHKVRSLVKRNQSKAKEV